MNKENEQKDSINESASDVAKFSLDAEEAIRLICRGLSLFPWAESELAARMTPAFLAAALGGVKAAKTNRALMLHITGGDERTRAALCQYIIETLSDSPAVLEVKAGTDTAGIAAALRSAPAARLLILEDAEPARGSLRYLREMAPDVAILAFSEKSFINASGGLAVGAVELRLRAYIDKTEEKTLEEWREKSLVHVFRMVKAKEAAAALRQIETEETARIDISIEKVEKIIRNAYSVLAIIQSGIKPQINGVAAILCHKGEIASLEKDDKITAPYSYLVSGATISRCEPNMAAALAALYACRPFSGGETVLKWRKEYENSLI